MNKSIQKVVDTIQQYMIEDGQLIWQKPYFSASQSNAVSRREYRGINHFVTSIVSFKQGYSSPYWATFRQIRALGGTLKDAKGKGVPIVFYKDSSQDTDQDDSNTKRRFVCRHSFVFNLDLVEGVTIIDDAFERSEFATHADAESVITSFIERENISIAKAMTPAYVPVTDTINMPPMEHFISQAEYYSAYFHESAHASGHNKRLARFDTDQVRYESKEDYSREELVAEISACLMCNHCGVDSQDSIKNSAAYLQGWSKFISDDAQAFVTAVSQAYKARDFILDNGEV